MMKQTIRRFGVILGFFTFLIPSIALSAQENRIALVIGNGAYKSSPLANPVNDANDMGTALKNCNFTVMKFSNASTHKTFIPAIRKVVDAPNPTLVIWVHGIGEGSLKREIVEMGVNGNIQCLIGYGQPDRSTAEKKTVDGLIRSFKTNSIIAHVARIGSNYGGNSTQYMTNILD